MSTVKVIVTSEEEIKVPDTGSFVFGDSGHFGGFGIGMMILTILIGAVTVAVVLRRRAHKSFKLGDKSKKITGLFVILLLSATLFIPLTIGEQKNDLVFADEGDTELSVTAGDTTINVELSAESTSKAVYAGQSVTVDASTVNGYTLSMYASSADLLPASSENESKISGLSDDNAVSLANDSWGVALSNPSDSGKIGIWRVVPTTEADALVIRNVSSATPANDKSMVYYGVRVTDATKDDTYSTTVTYVATAKI